MSEPDIAILPQEIRSSEPVLAAYPRTKYVGQTYGQGAALLFSIAPDKAFLAYIVTNISGSLLHYHFTLALHHHNIKQVISSVLLDVQMVKGGLFLWSWLSVTGASR